MHNFFTLILCCQISAIEKLPDRRKMHKVVVANEGNCLFTNIRMDFLREIAALFNEFIAFLQVADQDDEFLEHFIWRRRRNDILRRFLERERANLTRIHENRTVYYSAYLSCHHHHSEDLSLVVSSSWL